MHAKIIKPALLLVLAAGLGTIAFVLIRNGSGGEHAGTGQTWTCSMHPQVRMAKPGLCPVCAMQLTPVKNAASAPGPKDEHAGHDMAAEEHKSHPMLVLSDHARAMAGVETTKIEKRALRHEIRAVGKVQYNESALAVIVSRVEGYIEKLFVDYTGLKVKKGDHLAEIYSPDLVLAQRELLVALEGPANSALTDSARLKLLRWGLTSQQVDELVQNRKVSERMTLYSPIDGTVTERMAVQQAMVKPGEALYKLASLESVWVYLDIYENELSWVQPGQTVSILTEAYPAETFSGRIWFINPVLTEESRTVKVLVNIENTGEKLKPGMFVSATINVQVMADGSPAPTGLEGKFACPMHPQVVQDHAGACPRCGMALAQIPGRPVKLSDADVQVLSVPVSAVLDGGLRKVVFMEHKRGEFMPVEVTLGPRAGAYYPVLKGLNGGELVAVRGGFLLDSQLQIQGMPSLFYEKGQAPAAGHQHGGAPATAPNPAGHEGHTVPPAPQHKH
ncbi:MAG: efflux RND transporter periplasmic adaptor subunit [Verrucomicrobiaceae bacterium]